MSQPENPSQSKPKQAPKAKQLKEADMPPLPDYAEARVKLFEDLKRKYQDEIKSKESKKITLTLADGRTVEGQSWKTTPMEIAKSLAVDKTSVVAKVNGKLWDLLRPLEEDATLEYFSFDSEEGKKTFWHSSAHILGQALERFYHCSLCIGPALDDGFYYDAATGDKLVSPDHFETIEGIANWVAAQKQPFERVAVPKPLALEMFKYNKYKTEIINTKVPDGETITVYRCGPLIDLCRGPHLPNTGYMKAFKVTKNSSSYWGGNSENDSLQRVYGISFPDKQGLEEWVKFQEEAAKRDHRNVGKAQDLFFFHQLSPGSCFFLPHGARIYNKLIELIRREYHVRGFTEVVTPNVYNATLWETSGHWPLYKENMFHFEADKTTYALKPMNCPGHCLMFDHKKRSYRELPIRFADFGVLHRNEYHGALTGLTRVRRFQQDDAHIFCGEDHIKAEIHGALQFMQHIYGIFGFDFALELSTRPEKFLGDIEVWNKAENALKEVLNEFGKGWKLNPGDGAFYGPKIDIHITDALKRSHQCATIQLDFQLPIRFKLEYEAGSGESKRPVIIHRAVFGSVERFLGILIEHTGGKWPFWISPRQGLICTVADKFNDYAIALHKKLHDAGYYVDLDMSDRTIPKKVREAQVSQYNYILVVGQEEISTNTVNVRTRDNVVHGARTADQILEEWAALVKQFK
jgi:threonyl-tRNA synthetase